LLAVPDEAVLAGDAETFKTELSALLAETISYHDTRESFYHGFTTGVFSRIKGYSVKSNRESGSGRGDIFIIPTSIRKTAAILELKVADTAAGMEKTALDALAQIDAKNYEQELQQVGYSDILKYGIAFYRKDCTIAINNE